MCNIAHVRQTHIDYNNEDYVSRSPSSTDKMLKLLGWMSWSGFEPRYLHLCVSLQWLCHFVYLPKKKWRLCTFTFKLFIST